MVDAKPEPTNEEKMRVPPPPWKKHTLRHIQHKVHVSMEVLVFLMKNRGPLTNHRMPIANFDPGADPGFLERVFICINVWGFALLILSQFA